MLPTVPGLPSRLLSGCPGSLGTTPPGWLCASPASLRPEVLSRRVLWAPAALLVPRGSCLLLSGHGPRAPPPALSPRVSLGLRARVVPDLRLALRRAGPLSSSGPETGLVPPGSRMGVSCLKPGFGGQAAGIDFIPKGLGLSGGCVRCGGTLSTSHGVSGAGCVARWPGHSGRQLQTQGSHITLGAGAGIPSTPCLAVVCGWGVQEPGTLGFVAEPA